VNIALRTVLVLVVLSLILIAIIVKKQYTLNTGTPILLETQPIDPRSLFRGDYVTLSYTIDTLELDALGGDDAFRPNRDVYVVLQQGETYWEPVSVHARRPAAQPSHVVIRGRVTSVDSHRLSPETGQAERLDTLQVDYGIGSYFVPEGEGRELERPSAGNRVDLRIVVDRFGKAAIRAVLVNGEVRYRESLL
jgi:uncharacterized membrane-anchored protein